MARTSRRTDTGKRASDWREISAGVSIKGNADRFSLNWHGAVIHGCRIQQGKGYEPFISWPSFKGNNGDYIRTSYVYAEQGSDDESILMDVIDTLLD